MVSRDEMPVFPLFIRLTFLEGHFTVSTTVLSERKKRGRNTKGTRANRINAEA
jgi:hypothetical protein